MKYVLIGGVAARLHGSPDLTEDVDITPEESRENLTRLAVALREIGARLRGAEHVEWPIDAHALEAADIFTLTTDLGMLDLCFRPGGEQTYEQLAKHAQTFEIFGLEIPVASLDDIIESKVAAGRNKDLRALPTLRLLQDRLRQ